MPIDPLNNTSLINAQLTTIIKYPQLENIKEKMPAKTSENFVLNNIINETKFYGSNISKLRLNDDLKVILEETNKENISDVERGMIINNKKVSPPKVTQYSNPIAFNNNITQSYNNINSFKNNPQFQNNLIQLSKLNNISNHLNTGNIFNANGNIVNNSNNQNLVNNDNLNLPNLELNSKVTDIEVQENPKIELVELEGKLIPDKSLVFNAGGLVKGSLRNAKDGITYFGLMKKNIHGEIVNDYILNFHSKSSINTVFKVFFNRQQRKYFLGSVGNIIEEMVIVFVKIEKPFVSYLIYIYIYNINK